MIVSGIESEMNLRHLELDRVLPAEIHAASLDRDLPPEESQEQIPPAHPQRHHPCPDHGPPGRPDPFGGNGRHLQHPGVLRLPDITISTTYPYGLFEKSITFDAAGEVVVFPRPLVFSYRQGEGLQDAGASKASDSISHVRPYSPAIPCPRWCGKSSTWIRIEGVRGGQA